jgi:broad specificity phosphatase PhoE
MRRLAYCFLLLLYITGASVSKSYAQNEPEPDAQLTTFILIRHAEKVSDGTKDPGLTSEGLQRAERLRKMLDKTEISAIYSTPFKRTKQTVDPLAGAHKLKIVEYDPFDEQLLGKWLKSHRGATVVVSGHSNTTPDYVNKLIGEQKYSQLAESDYSNIYIVTVRELGEGMVTQLRY